MCHTFDIFIPFRFIYQSFSPLMNTWFMVFVLLTKNERLESKYSSFWQKYNLLFYSLVKKIPFCPIGGPLAGWLLLRILVFPSKTNAQKIKIIHFDNKITFYFIVKSKKSHLGQLAVWACTMSSFFGHQK